LLLKGYSVEMDKSGDTFNKKIMNAQKDGFNFIGVIGK
jgi:threonyl-tRNA synthetase